MSRILCQYEVLVDQNARYRNLNIVLQPKTFYGRLLRIFEIQLSVIAPGPANRTPSSPPQLPPPVVLAAIQTCHIERSNNDLDIHYYTRMGNTDYVDITTIQCVVGRVKDRGRFAIIDRSGSLARALFREDESND